MSESATIAETRPVGVLLVVAPIWWMFAASFMDEGEIFSGKAAVWPAPWVAANYVAAAQLLPLFRNLLNSIIIAGGHTLLAVFFASLAIPALGFNIPWGAIMAGSVLAVLPPVLIFLLFQRSFVAGVTLGGVKE